VVEHPIQHHPHAAAMHFVQQGMKIIHRPQLRIDAVVIGRYSGD
jgi:hypothetical protein